MSDTTFIDKQTVVLASWLNDVNTLTYRNYTFPGVPSLTTRPAQFDNSNKIVDSGFVQRALGNSAGVTIYGASTALTLADCGKTIYSSGGFTLTLPAANTTTIGTRILFVCFGSPNFIVARAGTDTIVFPGISSMTSITIGLGSTLELESNGSTQWSVISGSASLSYANEFLGQRANPGYITIPGNPTSYIQFGSIAASVAGVAVTYPKAFNFGTYSLTSGNISGPSSTVVSFGGISPSGFTVYASAGTPTVSWSAFGF